MGVKLLTEHHLDFLSLTGGCTGSSEFTLVKMLHCWKSHVTTQLDYHSVVIFHWDVISHNKVCCWSHVSA